MFSDNFDKTCESKLLTVIEEPDSKQQSSLSRLAPINVITFNVFALGQGRVTLPRNHDYDRTISHALGAIALSARAQDA